METLRSTFTGHPQTGATIELFISYSANHKRAYLVRSRFQDFKSFVWLADAEKYFEEMAINNA